MSFTLLAFIYFLIWWTTLFAILPLGVRRHNEDGKGFDSGAPEMPNLKRKLILNTIVSAFVLLVIWILVETNIIRWQDWFDGGAAQ